MVRCTMGVEFYNEGVQTSQIIALETLIFIFGALLTLIGLLGGGFEAKEIKIPKIAGIGRLISLIFGLSLIWFGYNLSLNDNAKDKSIDNSNQREESGLQVYFTIQDELIMDDFISDYEGQTAVYINGLLIGTVTISSTYPLSSITASMPNEGRYDYYLEGSARITDYGGNVSDIYCMGNGTIDVESGKVYQIIGRYDANQCVMMLRQKI